MNLNKFNVDDLIDRKLVRVKQYPDQGLRVLKYDRTVFFNNLWNTDSRLLDCRGTIVDDEDNIVTMPFTKVFNLFENNTTVHRDTCVTAVEKVNGFMAAASMHDGNLLVSTTGTIDSDYATMACDYIGDIRIAEGVTLLFEICSPDDPHIVQQEEGAYLIGIRGNFIGSDLMPESALDAVASSLGFLRPHWFNCNFQSLRDMLPSVKHEGYMIRDAETGETLCKVKSPYYLAKKFFMRVSKNKLDSIWGDQQLARRAIDEEYYELLEWLPKRFCQDDWAGLEEQQRRVIIEEYFKCQY